MRLPKWHWVVSLLFTAKINGNKNAEPCTNATNDCNDNIHVHAITSDKDCRKAKKCMTSCLPSGSGR